jgi:hypothetical protein
VADPAGRPPKFVLYSRQYCHLCADMFAALEALRGELGFEIDVIDVDADPALAQRSDELVPVLTHGGSELARWRLDPAVLRAYMENIG